MRPTILVLLLFISAGLHSQPKKINAETSIQNVTLFSSGARVQRTAAVNLQPGRSEISFEGLSNQLEQQTVQLKADASIILLSVQTTRDFLTERKIEKQERDFIENTNTLKDKFDMDTKLMEVYKNEETMLIKNQAIGGTTGVKTADLKEALDLQRQRLTELYTKELDIQKRMVSAQLEMEKYKSQLMEISKKKDSISYIVTALVECKEIRTVNFQLLYNVKDAGWYPAYDVRVSSVTEPLHIQMSANVFQRSGETWKNISIVLSTGNPKENSTPAHLQPWMLGYFDPSISFRKQGQGSATSGRVTDNLGQPLQGATVSVKGTALGTLTDANGFFRFNNIPVNGTLLVSNLGYQSKEMAVQPGYFTVVLEHGSTALNDVVVVGYGSSELTGSVAGLAFSESRKDKVVMQNVAVFTQFQPTTTVYKIDEKYTLETDGKTTTIGMKEFEVPSLYEYYSVPKTDPLAFLTAKIPNWQDYDLQSGEVSLYFEGTYLGKTYIDLGTADDTLSLSLGKDNGVKISRRLVKEFSMKKFMGSSRTESRDYEITVRNTKTVAINITVQDQVPVSTTKEIEIEEVKAQDAQIDKETGIASWNLNVQPGQERKLRISYTVKYPKDRKLVLE